MSDELPVIHPSPTSESYRREVMEKHGIDPGPGYGIGLEPLEPLAWRPTRGDVLQMLKADIAPTGAGFEALVLGHTDRGPDILGTWGWLSLDDATWQAVASAYVSRGLSLVPCNAREDGYQGQRYDLTTDVALLRARLERAYRSRVVPMLNLQLYGDGQGRRNIDTWRGLLPQIADLITAAFLGWEVVVDGGPSGWTPDELDEMVALFREHCPHAVLGIEFATPEGHEPITYDGRAVPHGEEAAWWWKHHGQQIDVLMLEIGYHRADDERGFVDDVAGAVCRFQWPFPVKDTWPDGSPVDPGLLNNWRGPDYGTHKVVMLFEYAAYLCWPSERKRARRELVQWMVPTLGAYGEG